MFVHSAQTHHAMLELKNRRKKIQDLLDFNQKMGKTVAAKLVLTFLPIATGFEPVTSRVRSRPLAHSSKGLRY